MQTDILETGYDFHEKISAAVYGSASGRKIFHVKI